MQMIGIHTIEDCLEIITGLQKHNLKFEIDSSDSTIINSVARQVFKGTALTDRQYNLMKEKLSKYRAQFETQEIIGFDSALEKLRLPIRHIDRSRYIKLVDHPDDDIVYDDTFNGQLIKIRFPFKKSDIMLINEISNTNTYLHKKGSHSHFFHFNESNVVKLLDRFINKDFKIDEKIKDVYHKAKEIQNNKHSYISGIDKFNLFNIHKNLQPIIKKDLGDITSDNYLKFIDRRIRYGLDLFDNFDPSTLVERIAYRKDKEFLAKPSEISLNILLDTLLHLERFPMLVVLDKKDCEQQLYEFANYFRDIFPYESQSVLFRIEDSNSGFNQLVKDRKLNNWVDNNTKIVYISSSNLPKVLLTAGWLPITAFSYNSRVDRTVDLFMQNSCDLIVYREDELSPFRRYSKLYG